MWTSIYPSKTYLFLSTLIHFFASQFSKNWVRYYVGYHLEAKLLTLFSSCKTINIIQIFDIREIFWDAKPNNAQLQEPEMRLTLPEVLKG